MPTLREKVTAAMMAFQALADDDHWNGHIRGTYAECAGRLREILSDSEATELEDERTHADKLAFHLRRQIDGPGNQKHLSEDMLNVHRQRRKAL